MLRNSKMLCCRQLPAIVRINCKTHYHWCWCICVCAPTGWLIKLNGQQRVYQLIDILNVSHNRNNNLVIPLRAPVCVCVCVHTCMTVRMFVRASCLLAIFSHFEVMKSLVTKKHLHIRFLLFRLCELNREIPC